MEEYGKITLEIGAGFQLNKTYFFKYLKKRKAGDIFVASDPTYGLRERIANRYTISGILKRGRRKLFVRPGSVFGKESNNFADLFAMKHPAQQIPIVDGRVSHIIAKDVFGQPSSTLSPILSHRYDDKLEREAGHQQAIAHIESALSEFNRVLVPGGKLTLVEKQTPQYAYLSKIEEILKRMNYRVLWVNKDRDSELRLDRFGKVKTNILIAIKPKIII